MVRDVEISHAESSAALDGGGDRSAEQHVHPSSV
jgi:hypothetical protein